jgi:hypothetical protein
MRNVIARSTRHAARAMRRPAGAAASVERIIVMQWIEVNDVDRGMQSHKSTRTRLQRDSHTDADATTPCPVSAAVAIGRNW